MGVLGLKVDDELEQKFRKTVFERKGMKKGNITEALEEAINLWIDEEVAKDEAQRRK
ncbi:MAG: hypothetical protein M1503_04000 [Thaumarchaeota archaeon]|nr:hypothetical protein [Nitrososphaerota archaeon]MCL5317416.1 hypothetical protein [Nitrososphaerota archaeon]